MTTRTLTALFSNQAEAERASEMLVSDLHLDRGSVRISPGAGVTDAGYDRSRPYEEKGFFASLKNLFVPDEDRFAYAEGLRRGNILLSVQTDEANVRRASGVLEQAGALDLDAQEASWRQSGWTGYDANTHNTAAAPVQGASDDTLKVVEERLAVGKRVVEHGSVRVRAYIIERPVEVPVTLHSETVRVERHPVNRPVTPADTDAFREKSIEAHAVNEEPVVRKEARVVEEIALRKEAADRVETVRDTVRKTEVDVEDLSTANTTGATGTTAAGVAGTAGAAAANVAGAAKNAAGAVDRTLNTNISGTNPGRK